MLRPQLVTDSAAVPAAFPTRCKPWPAVNSRMYSRLSPYQEKTEPAATPDHSTLLATPSA